MPHIDMRHEWRDGCDPDTPPETIVLKLERR